jgi:hypothetical protein
MKTRLIALMLLAATLPALGEDDSSPRDGATWQAMSPLERGDWALGWMDGINSGRMFALRASFLEPYTKEMEQFVGLRMDELAQGLDQFYEADYRNLRVPLCWAALFVARYRNGMSTADAKAELEQMRKTSHVAQP